MPDTLKREGRGAEDRQCDALRFFRNADVGGNGGQEACASGRSSKGENSVWTQGCHEE